MCAGCGAYQGRLIAVIAAVLLDVATSVILYASVHHWFEDGVSFSTFASGFVEFRRDSADFLAFSLARCCIVPLFVWGACKLGTPPESVSPEEDHEHEPLLVNDRPEEHGFIGTPDSAKEERMFEHRKTADFRRHACLMLMFCVFTVFQGYVGIKCVSFIYTDETLQGIIMASSAIWINAEVWLVKRLVDEATKEDGVFIAAVHAHRLYFTTGLTWNYCDVCNAPRIKDAYRCKVCDFDICKRCFQFKGKKPREGALRSDKGVKKEEDVTPGKYFKRSLWLARPEIPLLLAAFVCLSINSGANLLLPNYQGSILDKVVKGDEEGFWVDVRLFIILSVATGFFGGVRGLLFNVVGRRIANSVRNKLFEGIIRQDVAFFDGTSTGQLTSRLANDVNGMVAPCQTMLSSTLQNFIALVGGLIMCFHTSWKLSMLAFTTICPIIYITETYARWSKRLNSEIYAALGDANSIATESFGNIRTVRAFCTEELETARFLDATNGALQKGIKDAFGNAGAFALNNYLDLAAGVLILWYGGLLALRGDGGVTVGRLITFQLYWGMINGAYKGLMNVLTSFTRSAGAATRVLSLMDSLPDIDGNEGKPVDVLSGDIELKNVSFVYQMRPDNKVLNKANLRIEAGKVCALVGRSGGGKSTICHLIMRFYDPMEGSITIDGDDIRDLRASSLRKQMATVAQDSQLFGLTIEENIAYGMTEYSRSDLIAAAKAANCHDFILTFDEGYQTRVGERGVRLSGGQKQRIAIARVMLRKPRVLILDEATSALDTESEALVQEALDTLIQGGGRTVLLVAHRLSTVINADKIAVVDGGQIIEEGTHEELLLADGAYAKLVRRQVRKQANQIEGEDSVPIDVIDSLLEEDVEDDDDGK